MNSHTNCCLDLLNGFEINYGMCLKFLASFDVLNSFLNDKNIHTKNQFQVVGISSYL